VKCLYFLQIFKINIKFFRKFHIIFEFPEVFLRSNPGFDIIIGNPPYGGNVSNIEEKKFQELCDIGKPNIAKLFVLQGFNLTKSNGYLSLVVPKSLTYASDWICLRKYITGWLYELYDIKEAFKDVRLEQIFFILKKEKRYKFYKSRDFFRRSDFVYINKNIITNIDTLFCDLTQEELDIIIYILNNKKQVLTDIIKTYRGLPLQKFLMENKNISFNEQVIGGKNIALYSLIGEFAKLNYNDLPSKIVKELEKLKRPKIIFQNIVAFKKKPVYHIQVIGAFDEYGLIPLDTVNIIESKSSDIDDLFVLGFMNSIFFSWILHKISYNSAVRTMHLDNYALSKVPLPEINLNLTKEISLLVREVIKARKLGRIPIDLYMEIENKILSLYGFKQSSMPESYLTLLKTYQTNNWVK